MKSSPYALGKNEPFNRGILRILRQMTLSVRRLEKSPQSEMENSIHTLRLMIKRLRALLWLLRSALEPIILNRAKSNLRGAAGILAAYRDRKVILTTLQELKPKSDKQRRQIEMLANKTALPVTSGTTEKDALHQTTMLFTKTMAEVRRKIARRINWPDPEKQVAKAMRIARKTGKQALRARNDSNFHEWRKKVKRQGYLLELTQFQGFKHAKKKLKRVERLQNVLGEYHDCAIAQARLSQKPTRINELAVLLLEKKKKRLEKQARKAQSR